MTKTKAARNLKSGTATTSQDCSAKSNDVL
jgi:hypothetical protein